MTIKSKTSEVTMTMHRSDRRTDGRTDGHDGGYKLEF